MSNVSDARKPASDEEIRDCIIGERIYQRRLWGFPDQEHLGEFTEAKHDQVDWLTYIIHYAAKGITVAATTSGRHPVLHIIRKIAALALAGLGAETRMSETEILDKMIQIADDSPPPLTKLLVVLHTMTGNVIMNTGDLTPAMEKVAYTQNLQIVLGACVQALRYHGVVNREVTGPLINRRTGVNVLSGE